MKWHFADIILNICIFCLLGNERMIQGLNQGLPVSINSTLYSGVQLESMCNLYLSFKRVYLLFVRAQ